MGAAGGSFGQSFAQTLLQGHQIMAQVADRKEELTLRKKLVAAQLQEHEASTELATRKLSAMASLRDRLQPQFGEEEGAGVQPAAPLGEQERLRYAMDIDPQSAAKEMLKGAEPKVDIMGLFKKMTEEQAAPPATAAPAEAPIAEAPAPSGPAPGPAAATPGLGPQRKLDRTVGLSMTDEGKLKLDLKVGERNVNFKIDHETVVGPDGRAQVFRVTTNPEDPRQVIRVPVGPAVPPAEIQKWAQAAEALGLKPGTDLHDAAVTDFLFIANTMQPGRAQEIAFEDLAAKYRTLATARPAGAAAPATPGTSPRARAQAEEITQLTKKAAAEAGVKTAAQQDAPIGDDATRYVNRRTLQHPEASRKRKDIEGDPNLVQLSPEVLKKLPQILTTRASLDRLEAIVRSSPDLFPPSTGSAAQDIGRVAAASARWAAKRRTDQRIGEVESLKITMPGTIKLFGDSGNISEAERAMAESALGLQSSTQEQALTRIDAIRSMVDNTVEPMGLGPFPRKPGPKPAEAPAAKSPGVPRFRYDDKTGRLIPVQP